MSLFVPPVVRATDANNDVLSGALWYFYATGTSTLATIYTTSALSVAHTNPVVANSGGLFAPIYLDPTLAYRATLKTAAGVTVQDIDPVANTDSDGVRFLQTGAGAVARTVQSKLRDVVSLKDFGALGDGATNDTAAVTAALTYIAATGNPVYVPPGTYLTEPFQIAPTAYASQGFFYGLEAASTVFQRRTAGAGAFVTVGSAAGAIFQANLVFAGITIDGGATTNGDACVLYDVVRSRFDSVIFSGGAKALHSYGGIALTFADCTFTSAVRGFVAEKFTSSAGGGYPNLIRLDNPRAVLCSQYGVWFDHGRMLQLIGGQIESNGTALAGASGGIYVGANVGEEVVINDAESIALIVDGSWFEANLGAADIHLNAGLNSIVNSNFFSTSLQTTNDVKIDGGRYCLKNLNASFSKTANVLEGAGAASGNLIEFVEMANLSYDATKTTVRPIVGVGYSTGAGGTVIQATNKGTGVTLNKACGAVTLNNAALASNAVITFILTNSLIATDDYVDVWMKSGHATGGTYRCWSEGNASGSRIIALQNISGGSLSEAVVLGFGINKRVAA